MVVARRRYRTAADLAAVSRLLRDAWAAQPRFNAWTFARFDIWAQRRIADELLDAENGWRYDVALWDAADGSLVAAAFIGESPNDGVLVLDPAHAVLADDLVAWVEERCVAEEPLLIEVNESNAALGEVLARRGYETIEGHFLPRAKRLDRSPRGRVRLPEGFRIEELSDELLERYHRSVFAVFGRSGTVAAYRFVQQAPSHVPELNLVVLDERDEVVSFCTAWVDRELGLAEFEPVGTVPELQRLGLGSAVMTEAENRMRRLGVTTATVHSWSTMEGANRLYDGLGYERVDRQRNWQRPV